MIHRALRTKVADARQEQIRRALRKRVDVALQNVTLADFAAQLEKMLGVTVRIDTESLDEMDLSPQTPLTVRLSGISAPSVLELPLKPFELTWIIGEDCVFLCSEVSAEEHHKARIYDAADLVVTVGDHPPEPDFEPVIEMTMATVEPETWADMGGSGTIEPLEGGGARVLVIAQTWSIHEQIEDLLALLRNVRRHSRGRPLRP